MDLLSRCFHNCACCLLYAIFTLAPRLNLLFRYDGNTYALKIRIQAF